MEELANTVSYEVQYCRSQQEIKDVVLKAIFEALKKVREETPTIKN